MNEVTIIGNVTGDPEVRYAGETVVAHLTVAVKNPSKGEDSTSFIRCVAFNKTAENIEKYVFKGSKVGIVGYIKTGSYTNKDGKKVYTTDVVINKIEFLSRKESTETTSNDFISVPDGVDVELPFN